MYEWLLGVENDTYLSRMYFLLCLDYEESHDVVEWNDEADVNECI